MSARVLPFDSLVTAGAPRALPEIPPIPITQSSLRQLIGLMDLTTLSGDDSEHRVRQLCDTARTAGVPAVCVYPAFVAVAKSSLAGSDVKVATVAAAFPHGLSPFRIRVAEVESCRELGADEIDIVIRREAAINEQWTTLYQEIAAFRSAAGEAHLKVILATGEIHDPVKIYRASRVAMLAGADFVKTSTGKEATNATLEATAATLAAIADHRDATGRTVGLKPAGGIRTADVALQFVAQASAVLGDDFIDPNTFRLGVSGLLDDVLQRLDAASTGGSL